MRKDAEQILKLEKLGFDIDQRDRIIKNYEGIGSIDRNTAIEMIVSLRRTDPVVLAVTCIDQLPSNESGLLTDCTNKQLIDELKLQLKILTMEYEGYTSEMIINLCKNGAPMP